MAAPMKCCIHVFRDEKGQITSLSEASFQKISDCTKEWLSLEGVCHTVAKDLASDCEKLLAGADHTHAGPAATAASTENPFACLQCMKKNCYGYHRRCYMKYTDVTRIKASRVRLLKREAQHAQENAGRHFVLTGQSTSNEKVDRPKRLRTCSPTTTTATDVSTVGHSRKDFFPEACLICDRDRYYCETHTRKR